jgi:hypothetical protein
MASHTQKQALFFVFTPPTPYKRPAGASSMPYRPNIAYKPYHASATATKAAAGMLFDGTSNTTIAGAGSASFTLHTRLDGDPGWITVGSKLIIDVGASAEIVTVTAVWGPSGALDSAANPFTITATFANAHSSGFAVRCTRGTRLGGVYFGALGTGCTLTLFNGHPDAGGATIAVITPASNPFLETGSAPIDLDFGLFYTYAGTPGDVTINAAPIPL